MGVPALFRWLSRKYPKIVLPVVEEQPVIIPGRDGEEPTEIPVDMRKPNPNGFENDCLYLDANGIVHNCTHPEGKPAPKTEEDMMMEVFKYTDRVVNMARPRKVLLIAIDGVAPRAKMNQQRSRRFRSAEEAKTKAAEKEEAIKDWEAMGKVMSDEYKNEEAWDSNAITPGTPFMDLLAASLRYWVAYKMNTDSGWANLQVIISDAGVPGEGEHKIMDFVRRQRSQPGYDANTTHVFYGLDADLIMLSLATHEPNFKILREDVFAQAAKRGCHKCGEPGHHSSKCTGLSLEKKVEAANASKSSPLKPFIFLDVCVLREYLQVELDVPGLPFRFDVERAIDDWVFMIFFVGNDFLPHLPSLDIREGAIDMLLKIWRAALPQMGGYLTNNGSVDLSALQYIMDALSTREDEIFRKRKEVEQRQEEQEKEKKRRIEMADNRRNGINAQSRENEQHSFRNTVDYVPVLKETQPHQNGSASTASWPAAPVTFNDSTAPPKPPKATVPSGPPKPKNPMFVSSRPTNAPIRGGFNYSAAASLPATSSRNDVSKDMVVNRAAIRKANLSAADMLRAELAAGKGLSVKEEPAAAETVMAEKDGSAVAVSEEEAESKPTMSAEDGDAVVAVDPPKTAVEPDGTVDALISTPPVVAEAVEEDVPAAAVDGSGAAVAALTKEPSAQDLAAYAENDEEMSSIDANEETIEAGDVSVVNGSGTTSRGKKRTADEADIPATKAQAELAEAKEENGDRSGSSSSSDDEDEDAADKSVMVKAVVPKPLKMLGGNMVEQEDTVKLWEPGYKQRYYEQKFGVGIEDADFRRECARAYVEGLCWVLAYYYNGCPSWTWYYPQHFAPFASDFTDLHTMDIKFDAGGPVKPFEQLMGVFPAASRKHIPEAFQGLMTEEDSEIIDFYPEKFSIDMNGKKMLWQGVALLPFIDRERLLAALAKRYSGLTEDEVRRNSPGNDVIFVNEDNPFYNQICSLYMKRKVAEPMTIDATLSKGIRGTILPDENCVPNSTYVNPLTTLPLSDLNNDRSISAIWFLPTQHVPHKSILLPGYREQRRILTTDDISNIHRGISGDDGSHHRRGAAGDGFHQQRRDFEQGPGYGAPRRDARNISDPRRSSGGYNAPQQRSGYDSPSNGGRSYGNDSRDSPYRDAYSGYSTPSTGYNSPAQQPYQSSYGGYGGSSQAPPAPQQQSSYGGYGGSSYSGGSSYGGYGGTSSAPTSYAASNLGQHTSYPPTQSSYSAPSSRSYGAPYQPPAPQGQGYGYGPPASQPPPAPYGSYGGYGQAATQPPQQAGYRPPPPLQSQYTNRGAIVPPHLQGQGQSWPQQGQHQKWNR